MQYRPVLAIGLLATALIAIGCQPSATPPQAQAPIAASTAPPSATRMITLDHEKSLVSVRATLYAARPFGKGAVYIQEAFDKPDSSSEVRYADPSAGPPQVVAKAVTPGGHVDVPAGDWPWLTWLDWSQSSGQWSLLARHMESGAQVTVAASGADGPPTTYAPPMPSISGTQIVWTQVAEDGKGDLYLYDTASQKRRRLTTSGDVGRAEIAGGRVIFARGLADDEERLGLWSLDLATGQQQQVVKGHVGDFAFGGQYLAYAEFERLQRGSRDTLFLLDLQTGQRRQLAPTTAEGTSYYLTAGDEWVAWQGPEPTRLHAYSPVHPEQPERVIEVPGVLAESGYILHPAVRGKHLIWLGLMGSRPLGTHQEMVYQMWLD